MIVAVFYFYGFLLQSAYVCSCTNIINCNKVGYVVL